MPVYPVAAGFATSCASPGCWCRDRRPCYPSDLTDAQWEVLEPRAREVMRELTIAVGRPMVHDLRAMCDAVAYVVKNGVEWRALPADLPPWQAAYVSDKAGAKLLLIQLFNAFSTLRIMWADTGYNGKPLARYAQAAAAITVEVVARTSPHSFQVLRRRWVVERTFGWLMRYRRLARDYERTTANSEAMIYWATVIIMTRRLARYENGRPPIQRWGGERSHPPQQAALSTGS
jgi:transposase